MNKFASGVIQMTLFSILFFSFLHYNTYRSGIEYSKHLKSGIKMYRDNTGVRF